MSLPASGNLKTVSYRPEDIQLTSVLQVCQPFCAFSDHGIQ